MDEGGEINYFLHSTAFDDAFFEPLGQLTHWIDVHKFWRAVPKLELLEQILHTLIPAH